MELKVTLSADTYAVSRLYIVTFALQGVIVYCGF
jgi:hypothetical protein